MIATITRPTKASDRLEDKVLGKAIEYITHNVDYSYTVEETQNAADALLEKGSLREAELIYFILALQKQDIAYSINKIAYSYELESKFIDTAHLAHNLYAMTGEPEACYQLAFALSRLGKGDEALEYLLTQLLDPPSSKYLRLAGMILKGIGKPIDAADALQEALRINPKDFHSARILAEVYVELGFYQQALLSIQSIPSAEKSQLDRVSECLVYRFMGEHERAVSCNRDLIKEHPGFDQVYWTQAFNYSISGGKYRKELISSAKRYWELSGFKSEHDLEDFVPTTSSIEKLRVGFLTADIGEHVVSNFLAPLLRGYNRERYTVELFSTARRFEAKAQKIINLVDYFVSLEAYSRPEARKLLRSRELDILIDTNGFTRNSGLPIIATRCANIQCHYIGYHATTGLDTIDYFIGDRITAPPEFQDQFTEKLVQLPSLWMAYDPTIEFPIAASTSKRYSPVFGSFSQASKINALTLEYWSAALKATPEAILVLKDRGYYCQRTKTRIEAFFEDSGVSQERIYFFEPVESLYDHLDAYNAIDIALDTIHWSSSTTAFEATGMGVPMVAISGDSFSSRMSSSIVSAAGKKNLLAKSPDEFAMIAANLARSYIEIRENKGVEQQIARQGLLFDQQRICNEFFGVIDQLAKEHAARLQKA